MRVRIERTHRYEFWLPGESDPGFVEVTDTPESEGDTHADIYLDDGEARVRKAAIPALIAALTSYQSRLMATENEEQDA